MRGCCLREVNLVDEKLLRILYQWAIEEPHRDRYTCRPITALTTLEKYLETTISRLEKKEIRIFVFLDDTSVEPYGRMTAFDYNPRNESAEFGYYLPSRNRGAAWGYHMTVQFLRAMFQDERWNLHKLYATTASGNIPSVRLLEKVGFHLDGVLRDHYWFTDRMEHQLHYSLLKSEWERST